MICLSSVKRYLKFVKPYRWRIVGTIFIGLIKFAIPLAMPLLLKYIIDDIIGNSQLTRDEQIHQLYIIMGIMFLIYMVIRPPIEYFRQYFAQWTATRILVDVRSKLYSHLQKLSFKYYANAKVGEVISRMINDVEATKDFVITGLMNLWLDVATIFFVILIMFSLNVKLTLVSLIMLPLYAISVRYFFGRLRALTRRRSQALAEMQGYLHEKIQGVSVIKSFAIEDYEQENFKKKNVNFMEKALDHTRWNAKSFAIVNTITDIAPLVIIFYCSFQVIDNKLTLGTMIAFIGYIDRLYDPLRRLVNSSTTLTQSFASMDRVFDLFDEKYDIDDKEGAKECKEVHGDISFENVYFSYYDDDRYALKNINLDVKRGETIAFVGMSGGGKSSLVSLLPRFYDISGGRITLDGQDIRDVTIHSLRDKIGVVFQDSILFSDSVHSNILVGKPDATFAEVKVAARQANAETFISELPEGYDTLVGERGVKLSGGQKQRISIARVFLKNPPILILDEATSALDLESEHLIQESIIKLSKDRTTFIVAHRLSTITHANRIVMLEHGEITEIGTHQELMAKQGAYYRLFQVQQLES